MAVVTIKKKKLVCKSTNCKRLVSVNDLPNAEDNIKSLDDVGEVMRAMFCDKHKAMFSTSWVEFIRDISKEDETLLRSKLAIPEPFSDEAKELHSKQQKRAE